MKGVTLEEDLEDTETALKCLFVNLHEIGEKGVEAILDFKDFKEAARQLGVEAEYGLCAIQDARRKIKRWRLLLKNKSRVRPSITNELLELLRGKEKTVNLLETMSSLL